MKVIDLINYSLQTGKKIEERASFYNIEDDILYTYRIGIELKKGVWYWWDLLDWDLEKDLVFKHRYNCNNGAIVRSARKGMEAEEEIMKVVEDALKF